MKYIFFIPIIFLFIIGCSDDDIICDNSDCLTVALCEPDECFKVDNGSWTGTYTSPDTDYYHITFNPNNDNECLLIRSVRNNVNGSTPFEIVKYNINTKQVIVLIQKPTTIFTVKWHKTRSIYFSGGNLDGRLRRINEDGTMEEQITPDDITITEFQWLDEDNILAYDNGKAMIIDYDGNIIDENDVQYGIISPNTIKRTNFIYDDSNLSYLGIYENVEGWEKVFYIKEVIYDGLTWSPDGSYIYWTDRSGLNRIHVETRKAEMVRKQCSNDSFQQITFDNQGNLYAIRQTGKILNGQEYFETRPVRFDFNTCTLEDITPQ
jgi:hypothetical protein